VLKFVQNGTYRKNFRLLPTSLIFLLFTRNFHCPLNYKIFRSYTHSFSRYRGSKSGKLSHLAYLKGGDGRFWTQRTPFCDVLSTVSCRLRGACNTFQESLLLLLAFGSCAMPKMGEPLIFQLSPVFDSMKRGDGKHPAESTSAIKQPGTDRLNRRTRKCPVASGSWGSSPRKILKIVAVLRI
jgi:hypothetical protein